MFKPSEVYIVSDGPNSALRRKLIDKGYKASRKKEWNQGAVKAYDFLNEQDQSDNFSLQMKRLYEYFDILPVKTLSLPYVEADDLIAEIVNTMPSDTEAIIYSTDADYKQLVNERIICYNPMAKQLTTTKTFFDKHGYRVDNYIWLKVIVGDKSDELKGVDGIGDKTFTKLFPQMAEKHVEDLDEIFEFSRHAVESTSKTYTESMKKQYVKIVDSEELRRKNYTLMQLSDVNISLQSKDICSELQVDVSNKFNRQKLRMMFIKDKLNSHVKYFDDWAISFSNLTMRGIRL